MFQEKSGRQVLKEIGAAAEKLGSLDSSGKYLTRELLNARLGLGSVSRDKTEQTELDLPARVRMVCDELFHAKGEEAKAHLTKYLAALNNAHSHAKRHGNQHDDDDEIPFNMQHRPSLISKLDLNRFTPEYRETLNKLYSQIISDFDVEGALRAFLEFALVHAGPTNAALFLPQTSGDYTLGGYVNYTLPRESGEVLLDHLAHNVDRMSECNLIGTPLRFVDASTKEAFRDVPILDDNTAILAIRCVSQNDPTLFAYVVLFREVVFDPRAYNFLSQAGVVFGHFLSNVVKTHCRVVNATFKGLFEPDDDDPQEI